jgi:hypothetical protein
MLEEARRVLSEDSFAEGMLLTKEANEVFADEHIGWKFEDDRIVPTLPIAASEEVESVFRELQKPRFEAALARITAAYEAFNARPRREFDVCVNAFAACEAVAKEAHGPKCATFGDVLSDIKKQNRGFANLTIQVLEKLYALASDQFRHGKPAPFSLSAGEVEFVYLTCIAAILMFVRNPTNRPSE